jgi:hypothetical protein
LLASKQWVSASATEGGELNNGLPTYAPTSPRVTIPCANESARLASAGLRCESKAPSFIVALVSGTGKSGSWCFVRCWAKSRIVRFALIRGNPVAVLGSTLPGKPRSEPKLGEALRRFGVCSRAAWVIHAYYGAKRRTRVQ